MHLLAGEKMIKDEYKDLDVLPKFNRADMAGLIESFDKYLRSLCGVMRAPLALIIRKAITVPFYGNYSKYVTPYDEMIARMLHLPHK